MALIVAMQLLVCTVMTTIGTTSLPSWSIQTFWATTRGTA